MTAAEIQAYNRGVADMITLARRSAAAIASTSKRPLVEGFAVEALEELADAARALLLTIPVVSGKP